MSSFKSKWVAVSAAIGIAVASLAAAPVANAKDLVNVTFSLDFIPLGRHAPWYVAKSKGFYEEEGLNVKIIASKGSAKVIQAIESGLADIGFADVPGVVMGRAAGATLKMVAVIYQKAPYAIFSLSPGASVTSAKQLEGLTLGSGAGSFTPKVIGGFMQQQGLDPSKLSITNVAPPARGAMLLSGKVPAIEFFVMAKPGLTRAAAKGGRELKTFLLGSHGLDLYSNGIAATDAYIKKNPEIVRKFVRAALRGWQYALRNPEESAKLQRQFIEALDPEIIAAEIEVLKTLAVTDDTKANGLGWFDPAKIATSREFVLKNVDIKGTPPAVEDIYVSGFLPKEPIKP
jgi:NitT/TauT family transport system substrate-binding protein